ncbi:MAG: hypothetical protein HOB40_04210 [Candidatus Marinimicrobia bacterium]|jgi:hypothetical protein|nr:hypothetical protein [Candidatus Neomarinimicrobiota bacterium]MBT7556809.1 hypothetical protein [Candidatus Woesearchaeota archaeon]MBT3839894.1 hypothetical protein [Candidatus Neomarinimicrobiota bacterium]MBT3998492.1 hypothetical protein [Candidatus Neomarinimicrobiota bacterium]MBT4957560.1 hypothetical protein [Candidatus Neomarinimicrobiota bacterium]
MAHKFILFVLFTSVVNSGEVDHYLSWGHSLEDASSILNTKVNEIIDSTLHTIPNDCSCEMAAGKVLSGFGINLNSILEQWIKNTDKIDKFMPNIDLALRESIFSDHQSNHPQLDRAFFSIQVDEIINIGGIYVGLDKLTHFTGSGFLYYKAYITSKKMGFPSPFSSAIKVGIAGEKTIIGRMATGVFSYGDLEANFQGFRFALDMCNGDTPYLKFAKNRWIFSKKLDLLDYVNPNWDESYNPSFYFDGPNLMLKPKSTTVLKNLPFYCAQYETDYVKKLFTYYDSIYTASDSKIYLDSLILIDKIPNPIQFDIKQICSE